MDVYAAIPLNLKLPLKIKLDGFGIDLVFLHEDASAESVLVIVLKHRDHGLQVAEREALERTAAERGGC